MMRTVNSIPEAKSPDANVSVSVHQSNFLGRRDMTYIESSSMYKGNVAVCPRKFEGAKFLCSVFRLEKDHLKNFLRSKVERAESITQQHRLS
jgi:hypothetical protein